MVRDSSFSFLMERDFSSSHPCIKCLTFPFVSACVSLVLKYLIALEKTRMLKMYYEIVTFGDNIQVSNHSATDYCINKTQVKQKILV